MFARSSKYLLIILSLMVIKGLCFAGIQVTGEVITSSFTMVTGAQDKYVLTSDAGGNGAWQASISSAAIKADILSSSNVWTAPNLWKSSATFQNASFSVGGSTFVVKNGQVGIGTSTPSNALSVGSGNIDASGYIQAGGPNGGALMFSGYTAVNGTVEGGGLSFFGRPRIGDWGKWLQLGEPNGTNTGIILQISDTGIYTGTATGLGDYPTIRNTLDDGTGNASISGTLTVMSSGTLLVNGSGITNAYGVKTSTIQITQGAANGYVLTSDAGGNGTWQQTADRIEIAAATTTLKFEIDSVKISTGALQAELDALEVSTGTFVKKIGDTMTGELDVPNVDITYGVKTATLQVTSGASQNYVLMSDAGGNAAWQPIFEYVIIVDSKTSGTHAGSINANTWTTRTLNTITARSGLSSFSLSSNQITLSSGTYRLSASAPAYGCAYNKCQLYSVTNARTALVGTSEYAGTTQGPSRIDNILVVTGTSETFELRHRSSGSQTTSGLGRASSIAGFPEIYATVHIQKIR